MNDPNPTNPYAVTSGPVSERQSLRALIHSGLLLVFAIIMLVRGGALALEWSRVLHGGLSLNSDFMISMFAKDTLTCLTGLIGGLFILCRRAIGWWSSMMHWFWYLSWQVALVALGELLGWRFPVRHENPVHDSAVSLAVSAVAILFLLWPSTMRKLRVPTAHRFRFIFLLGCLSLLLALGLNWLSGL